MWKSVANKIWYLNLEGTVNPKELKLLHAIDVLQLIVLIGAICVFAFTFSNRPVEVRLCGKMVVMTLFAIGYACIAVHNSIIADAWKRKAKELMK